VRDTPEGGILGGVTSLIPATQEHLSLLAKWFAYPEFVRDRGGRPLTREEVAAEYTDAAVDVKPWRRDVRRG